jgi:hypothetical protein
MSNTAKPVFSGCLQYKGSGVSRILTSNTCLKRHFPAKENISVPYGFVLESFNVSPQIEASIYI